MEDKTCHFLGQFSLRCQNIQLCDIEQIYKFDWIFPHGGSLHTTLFSMGRHGRDRMIVGFTTTCAIGAYDR